MAILKKIWKDGNIYHAIVDLGDREITMKQRGDPELLPTYKRAYRAMTDFAIQQREELEAIQEIIKIPEVWSHPDPINAIREILETSTESDEGGKK